MTNLNGEIGMLMRGKATVAATLKGIKADGIHWATNYFDEVIFSKFVAGEEYRPYAEQYDKRSPEFPLVGEHYFITFRKNHAKNFYHISAYNDTTFEVTKEEGNRIFLEMKRTGTYIK